MQSDFPTSETFTYCASTQRHFEIEVRHLPNHGYSAVAREVTSAEHGDYVSRALTEASATLALAHLRGCRSAITRAADSRCLR